MSDLHIGAPNINYDLINEELAEAKRKSDRILINGDIFDLILPGDRKRFSVDAIHPKLYGIRDIVGKQIEWAYEILEPYAGQIDMIGVGNHDTAAEKFHSSDPVGDLVKRLQAKAKQVIYYGGYSGFIDYRFRNIASKNDMKRFVIYYHHGSGGDSPVTGGTIDLTRKIGWIHEDIIWMGHKHTRLHRHMEIVECPTTGWEPVIKEVHQIITGSYFDTYLGQTQNEIKNFGRHSNYAADKGLAPQGKGGARVELEFRTKALKSRVIM